MASALWKKAQLRRVAARDSHRCGIHLGGCGKLISGTPMKDYTRDHMISRAFRDDHHLDEKEFDEDWNIQPMHPKCDSSKDGKLREYPLFQCDCHYFRITNDGSMKIVEHTQDEEKAHEFFDPVTTADVSSYGRLALSIGSHYTISEETRPGHLVLKTPELPRHVFSLIWEQHVPAFNWFERVRVGREKVQYGVYSGSDFFLMWPEGHISWYRNMDAAKGIVPDVVPGELLRSDVHKTPFDAHVQFPVAEGWRNIQLLDESVKAWSGSWRSRR